ncbi:hypothetical protein OH77DRAFT_826676 [Trametes cingulata]|nr:hypothetical protein OH77DRAFT_826676 [Trametes cingulata]
MLIYTSPSIYPRIPCRQPEAGTSYTCVSSKAANPVKSSNTAPTEPSLPPRVDRPGDSSK